MKKLIKALLYIMPLCLYFSYYPVIGLGGSETMNFELSVALIWLVVFDAVVLVMLVQRKELFLWLKNKRWLWLLFPAWATISVIWSANVMRGALTVGILWLLYFAGYGMWVMKDLWGESFRTNWWKWFVGATLFVCAWCVVQCILDLAGIPRDVSLMCEGCTYKMFGFPHPNGFAIEPQFMGNLLLAPAIVLAWLLINRQNHIKLERERSRDSHFHNGSVGLAPVFQYRILVRDRCKNDNGSHSLSSSFIWFCFFVIAITLFLTFSRGAIYAFVVGMCFMTGFVIVRARTKEKGKVVKRAGLAWGVVVLAFLFTLNLQGIMAQVSPTNDTYMTGVGKAINHLSLGVIDLPVEKPVENFEENRGEGDEATDESNKEESVFDGYVEESTETRVMLNGVAMEEWSKDFKTALFGVGLGGAGQALYDDGLSPSPKEIVQNQYVSLLLETGVIGISLLVLTIIIAVRAIWKDSLMNVAILGLMVAYGVSLCFFAGLPNALQIYLMLQILCLVI